MFSGTNWPICVHLLRNLFDTDKSVRVEEGARNEKQDGRRNYVNVQATVLPIDLLQAQHAFFQRRRTVIFALCDWLAKCVAEIS